MNFSKETTNAFDIIRNNQATLFKETINGSDYISGISPESAFTSIYRYSTDRKTKKILPLKDSYYSYAYYRNKMYYFNQYFNKLLFVMDFDTLNKYEISLPDYIENPDIFEYNDCIYISGKNNDISVYYSISLNNLNIKDVSLKGNINIFNEITRNTFETYRQNADSSASTCKKGYTVSYDYSNNTARFENIKTKKYFTLPFISPAYFLENDYNIYFMQSNNINTTFLYRINYDGTGKKLLCKVPFAEASALNIIDNNIYILSSDGIVAECSIDGTKVQALYSGDEELFEKAVQKLPSLSKIGNINITDSGIFNGTKPIIDSVKISKVLKSGEYVYYICYPNSDTSYLYRLNIKSLKNECFINTEGIGMIFTLYKDKIICSIGNQIAQFSVSRIDEKPYLFNYSLYVSEYADDISSRYIVKGSKFFFYDASGRRLMVRDLETLKTSVLYKQTLLMDDNFIDNIYIKDSYLFFTDNGNSYYERGEPGYPNVKSSYVKKFRLNLKNMKLETLK
ncbi:MAG: hypothetical protein Q8880_12800 [Bacteroidota bacterium]|nr:hypothetical protein [Bacteroidota bacterium]